MEIELGVTPILRVTRQKWDWIRVNLGRRSEEGLVERPIGPAFLGMGFETQKWNVKECNLRSGR